MQRFVLACTILGLVCPGVWAGAVIEMKVQEPGSSGKVATDTIYAQGEMLRMDPHATNGKKTSMIFRDDTLWLVDHDKKVCQTIDKQGMEQLTAQLGGAMKQMEAALAQVPPEQRAMMEKMMKSKMAGMAGMGTEAAPRRMQEGPTEKVANYSCKVHTLYSGSEKVWEVCAAKNDLPEAASEAMEAFRAMSRFAEQLRDVVRQGPLANLIDTPFQDMSEVDGFPVRVRNFANGKMTSETTLESVTPRDIDAAVFSVPKGYKVKNLADEMNPGR